MDKKNIYLLAGVGALMGLHHFALNQDDVEEEGEDFGGIGFVNPKRNRRKRRKSKKKGVVKTFVGKVSKGRSARKSRRSKVRSAAKKRNQKSGVKWYQLKEKYSNRRTAKSKVYEDEFYVSPLRGGYAYDNTPSGIESLKELYYSVKSMKPGPKPMKGTSQYLGWKTAYIVWRADIELIRETYEEMKSAKGQVSGDLNRKQSQYR